MNGDIDNLKYRITLSCYTSIVIATLIDEFLWELPWNFYFPFCIS